MGDYGGCADSLGGRKEVWVLVGLVRRRKGLWESCVSSGEVGRISGMLLRFELA